MCDEYLSDYSDDSNDTDDGVSSETYFDEFDDVSDQESSEDFGLELEGEYDDDIIDYEEGPTELDEMLAECESDDMAYNEYYDMEKEEALEDMMDELYGSDEAEDIIQNEYYDAEKADELEAMMNELYEDSDDDSDDYMVKVKTR